MKHVTIAKWANNANTVYQAKRAEMEHQQTVKAKERFEFEAGAFGIVAIAVLILLVGFVEAWG